MPLLTGDDDDRMMNRMMMMTKTLTEQNGFFPIFSLTLRLV